MGKEKQKKAEPKANKTADIQTEADKKKKKKKSNSFKRPSIHPSVNSHFAPEVSLESTEGRPGSKETCGTCPRNASAPEKKRSKQGCPP